MKTTGQFTVLFPLICYWFVYFSHKTEKSHMDQGGRKSGKKSECRSLSVCGVNDLIYLEANQRIRWLSLCRVIFRCRPCWSKMQFYGFLQLISCDIRQLSVRFMRRRLYKKYITFSHLTYKTLRPKTQKSSFLRKT